MFRIENSSTKIQQKSESFWELFSGVLVHGLQGTRLSLPAVTDLDSVDIQLYMFRLLYAVFVASSEHVTIAELAATLQANQSQLEAAVSLASRLGWAKKVLDPEALLGNTPGSPTSEGSGEDFLSLASPRGLSPLWDGSDLLEGGIGDSAKPSPSGRMAFMVDASLTSYLMMGSLSPGSPDSPHLSPFSQHLFVKPTC